MDDDKSIGRINSTFKTKYLNYNNYTNLLLSRTMNVKYLSSQFLNNITKMLLLTIIICVSACGGKSSDISIANTAPTANAGQNQSVDEGTTVNLTGTGTDSDGSITAFNWIQISGPSVNISNANTSAATFVAPNTNETINLVFELTVTDNESETNTDSVNIAVSPMVVYTDHLLTPTTWPAFNFSTVQPGDKILLADGIYAANKKIDGLHGTQVAPITIRSVNPLGATIGSQVDDEDTSSDSSLRLWNSSHIVIQGLGFTNWAGIDGTTQYTNKARDELHEGLVIVQSRYITIENNRFDKIATRGVFVSGLGDDKGNITIRNNLFLDVGDDTAAGGINLNSGVDYWNIYDNLFATNVDGVVLNYADTGGNISNNLFLFNKFENAIDIKYHYPKSESPATSTISNNIIYSNHVAYSGIEVQFSSSGVAIENNVIYEGNGEGAILIRGRCGSPCIYAMEDISITGNTLLSSHQSARGVRFKVENSLEPADVKSVQISNNFIHGYNSWLDVGDMTQVKNSETTEGWYYQFFDNEVTGSMQLQPAEAAISYVNNNVTVAAEVPYEKLIDATDREIEFHQKIAQTFSQVDLQKAFNQQGVGYPVVSQQNASSDSLVITAQQVGLLTKKVGTELTWELSADLLALSGYSLTPNLGNDKDASLAAKASFRIRFVNPDENRYTLYARVRCGDIDSCTGGDSFFLPTALADDLIDNSAFVYADSSSVDYSWFYLGEYDVSPGRFQRLTFGGRERYFRLDSLVFHQSNNLVATGQTHILDDLITTKILGLP